MTPSSQPKRQTSVSQMHKVARVERGQLNTDQHDTVVTEEPLEIWVKQFTSANNSETIHLSTTMRTPGQDIALVRGWLHSLNVLDASDIAQIRHTGTETLKQQQSNRVLVTLKPGVNRSWNKVQHTGYTHSSCGICGQQSVDWLIEDLVPISLKNRFKATVRSVLTLPHLLMAKQQTFKDTGGCHGVGLFDASLTILDCQEDVGRHNAMDKLIGENLGRLPGPYGAILSGRVSFEMVQKAARAGISMIIAVGAPTSLAISLCHEFDIALAGFVKPDKFNIYTAAERFTGEI